MREREQGISNMQTRSYIPPKFDGSQDIVSASITRKDGITAMKFKKAVDSGDNQVRTVYFPSRREIY